MKYDLSERDIARFWALVSGRESPSACWEFIGARSPDNYGRFTVKRDLPRAKSHVLSYELAHGAVPAGTVVHHTCHNRACVNPDHLQAIPPSQNNYDQWRDKDSNWPVDYKPRGLLSRTPEERFWEKVDMLAGPDACWLWIGSRTKDGHGLFAVDGRVKAKQITTAHRFSYELQNGAIPEGMVICHSCDNPPCVNPAHLWLGTQGDNIRDMRKKGRANPARGSRHALAKLDEALVSQMRLDYLAGDSTYYLADKYGVSIHTSSSAIHGRTYAHVEVPDYQSRVPIDRRRLPGN